MATPLLEAIEDEAATDEVGVGCVPEIGTPGFEFATAETDEGGWTEVGEGCAPTMGAPLLEAPEGVSLPV